MPQNDEAPAPLPSTDAPKIVDGPPAPVVPPWTPHRMDRAVAGILVKNWSGDSKEGAQAIRNDIARFTSDLCGPNPTPMERELVRTAALAWMSLRYCECAEPSPNATIPQADFNRRRAESAHRRFLAAMRTLATVRRLAVQPVQVNFGVHQVNAVRTG